MDTIKDITIRRLTHNSVELQIEFYVEINSEIVKIDKPTHMVAYSNSTAGRTTIQEADYPSDVKNAIFQMWGDAPTMELQPPEVQ